MYDHFLQLWRALVQCGVHDPTLETLRLLNVLLAGALDRIDLSLLDQPGLDPLRLAEARATGVPWEYVLERAPFMGALFHCCPDTLIPTPETELLVRVALGYIEGASRPGHLLTVVDIGTGCGNVALSIAMNAPGVRVLASDISPGAVETARRNVEFFGLQDRVSLFCGDLFAALDGLGLEGLVDLVVCNPPYLPTAALSRLPPEIVDREPIVALDAGPFGLKVFSKLIAVALDYLRPGGILAFEIGAGQDQLVTNRLKRRSCYDEIRYWEWEGEIRAISAIARPNEIEP